MSDYGLPPALINSLRRLPMVIKIVGDFAWEFSVQRTLHRRCEPRSVPGRRGRAPSSAHQSDAACLRVRCRPRDRPQRLPQVDGVWLGRYSSSSIRVVHNAVPAPEHAATLQAEPPVVLTVARLAPWKGIDTLILAIDLLGQSANAPRLVIAGDGDDRQRLEQLANRQAPRKSGVFGAGAASCD